MILTHIFTANPFISSFVIPFSIRKISKGPYGTELTPPCPRPSATGATSTGSS